MAKLHDEIYKYITPLHWARPFDVRILRGLPSGDVWVDLMLWKQKVAIVCSNPANFPVEEYEDEYPGQRVLFIPPGDLILAMQHDMLARVLSMSDGEALPIEKAH